MGMIFVLFFLIGIGISIGIGIWSVLFQKKGLSNSTQKPWSTFLLISVIIFLIIIYFTSGIISFEAGSGPPPGEFYENAPLSSFLYGLSPGLGLFFGAIFNVKPVKSK